MIPIEFLRQFRLGGYAIFDFAASFLGIYLLSPLLLKLFLKIRVRIPKQSWLFLTLPIGICAHLLAGEMTPMTKDFIDIHGNLPIKILITSSLLLGIKDIKIIKK